MLIKIIKNFYFRPSQKENSYNFMKDYSHYSTPHTIHKACNFTRKKELERSVESRIFYFIPLHAKAAFCLHAQSRAPVCARGGGKPGQVDTEESHNGSLCGSDRRSRSCLPVEDATLLFKTVVYFFAFGSRRAKNQSSAP